jgi:hypothetical protein
LSLPGSPLQTRLDSLTRINPTDRTALAIAREQGTRGYELRAAASLARLSGE